MISNLATRRTTKPSIIFEVYFWSAQAHTPDWLRGSADLNKRPISACKFLQYERVHPRHYLIHLSLVRCLSLTLVWGIGSICASNSKVSVGERYLDFCVPQTARKGVARIHTKEWGQFPVNWVWHHVSVMALEPDFEKFRHSRQTAYIGDTTNWS